VRFYPAATAAVSGIGALGCECITALITSFGQQLTAPCCISVYRNYQVVRKNALNPIENPASWPGEVRNSKINHFFMSVLGGGYSLNVANALSKPNNKDFYDA
jgi:hypothetical protein